MIFPSDPNEEKVLKLFLKSCYLLPLYCLTDVNYVFSETLINNLQIIT